MASVPSFNPNVFIPEVNLNDWKRYTEDVEPRHTESEIRSARVRKSGWMRSAPISRSASARASRAMPMKDHPRA